MLSETFVSRFKEAREKKNITIKALQPLVGASPSAMNGYATGKTLPPLDVASKIATELGVSLDWLCGIKDDSMPDVSIRNAGDYLRILSLLLTTKVQEAPTRTPGGKEITGGSVFGARMNEELIFIDKKRVPGHIIDFSSWQKILELHLKNELDHEMYSAWIEKKIEALSVYPIPYYPQFYDGPIDIEKDELPF